MSGLKDLIDFGESMANEFGVDPETINYKPNEVKNVDAVDVLVGGAVDTQETTPDQKKFVDVHKEKGNVTHSEAKVVESGISNNKTANDISKDVQDVRNGSVTPEEVVAEQRKEPIQYEQNVNFFEEKQKVDPNFFEEDRSKVDGAETIADSICFGGDELEDNPSEFVTAHTESSSKLDGIKQHLQDNIQEQNVPEVEATDGFVENVVINTTIIAKDSKEVLKEEQEILETRYFKDPPAIVTFGQRVTVNLGNFESVSFNVQVAMPVKANPNTVKSYVLNGGSVVKERLVNEIDDVNKYFGTDVTSKFNKNSANNLG